MVLEWMHWTPGTAAVIAFIFGVLIASAILDSRRRSYPRKGFLPIATTRGDRIFLSAVLTILIGIIWLLTPFPFYLSIIPAVAVMVIVLKWG
jgi:predicted small integral membrane protein